MMMNVVMGTLSTIGGFTVMVGLFGLFEVYRKKRYIKSVDKEMRLIVINSLARHYQDNGCKDKDAVRKSVQEVKGLGQHEFNHLYDRLASEGVLSGTKDELSKLVSREFNKRKRL